jgi:hypothetical protein
MFMKNILMIERLEIFGINLLLFVVSLDHMAVRIHSYTMNIENMMR